MAGGCEEDKQEEGQEEGQRKEGKGSHRCFQDPPMARDSASSKTENVTCEESLEFN